MTVPHPQGAAHAPFGTVASALERDQDRALGPAFVPRGEATTRAVNTCLL